MCNKKALEKIIGMIEQARRRIGLESRSELPESSLDQQDQATEHARQNCGWRNYTILLQQRLK